MAKRKSKTYEEKLQIIRFVEDNPSMKRCDIAEKFNIKRQTLCDLIKNADKVKANIKTRRGLSSSFKRVRSITYGDIDTALIMWFHQHSKDPELQISGRMLHDKANDFAIQFGKEAKISMSWIDRWKKRWGVGHMQKAVENGITENTIEEWQNNEFRKILAKYEPNNIYSVNETKLFWQMLPENLVKFLRMDGHSSIQLANHITLLVGANMNGTDKLPLLAVGKSKTPNVKNAKKLPIDYEVEENACMRSDFFEQYLRKLDGNAKSDRRKILLVLNSCPAHPHIELENIELAFLPSNAASKMLSINSGVIRNFKFHFRCILANRRLQSAEIAEDFKWSLLDCLLAVKSAWSLVASSTIVNCYHDIGFVSGDVSFRAESSSRIASLPENERTMFQHIWEDLQDMLGEMPSLEDYVDVDNQDDCSDSMTDQKIVATVSKDQSTVESTSNEEMVEMFVGELEPTPTAEQAIEAVDCIRRFALSNNVFATEEILHLTAILEQKLIKEKSLQAMQALITDYLHLQDT